MTQRTVSQDEAPGTLSPERARLVKLLLERQAQKAPPCVRRGADSEAPLLTTPEPTSEPASGPTSACTFGPASSPTSSAQQRLWFIDQLEGGSPGYYVAIAVRLHGDLDQPALKKALDTLVQRHDTLRTVFVVDQGEPKQQVAREGLFPLRVINLRNLDQTDRETRVRLQKIEEAHERFTLDTGPLIRGRLLQLAAEEHVLLITLHHIVSDGWSVGVLIREIATLYAVYRNNGENPLQPLPVQYADYTRWQRQWLQGEAFNKQLSYWREHLQGAPPLLELPTDRPRPAVQSYRGKNHPVILDERLTTRLKELARQRGMTLFMLLYAGWVALLARLSHQDDIVVGTPIANRHRPELEGLIGFFVNTLALRIQGVGNLTVAQLLEQVKETTLGAYRHQDLPFEKIVETLQPERSLSRNPIFQVMLSLQNAPTSEFNLPGLTATVEEGIDDPSLFDLFLSLEERGGRLVGSMSYATDLFDPETIARWSTYYPILLDGILVAEHGHVHNLPLLPQVEQQLLAETFNATRTPYPLDKLIHELVESQVQRTPDALAVIAEDRRLTYAELDTRAHQLARYLRSKGVGPDQLVALCIHRSSDMVVGLLGILKAGGAYLPMDPSYPRERLAYMLEDAKPKLLLTQACLKERIPATTAEIVSLDNDWETITQAGSFSLPSHLSGVRCPAEGRDGGELSWRPSDLRPHHLAYVIYTSGSTGHPKGVAIEHRNTVNLIAWAHSTFADDLLAQTLQSTSLNFDLSVYEIFVPLTRGGTLVVVQNALSLRNQPTDVTLINTVPSALSGLLDSGAISPTTRAINLAGEALKKELVDRIFANTRVERVCNLYGPSETTTYSTWVTMTREGGFSATIGRPIANTQIHILDRQLQRAPIGVTGEIYIGGAGVARGYLNRPELTAERFILDPFSASPDARLYKTGDLGRWRPDGSIEYLGRNDHQIKIRGHRIELGEIEAQLSSHEHVKEAVVVAREDIPGDKRLVAYIVGDQNAAAAPANNAAPDELENTYGDDVQPTWSDQGRPETFDALRQHLVPRLRDYLKERLPEHMLPALWVMLKEMPLTPNGKVDRRALPAPQQRPEELGEYTPPRTDLERTLADIWAQVLRVDHVGAHDNFFELGGHSLLIVQLMERLRRLGLTTDIRSIYESPTLADLAQKLSAAAPIDAQIPPNLIPPTCHTITPQMLPLVHLQPEHIERIVQAIPGGASNIQDIYPLAPLQEGILFHHLLDTHRGDAYVRPLLLSLPSRKNLDALIAALQQVIDRHDILRTAVLWEQLPQPLQVVSRHARLPVEPLILDDTRDVLEQLEELMRPERQRLDLRQAPLIRLQVTPSQLTPSKLTSAEPGACPDVPSNPIRHANGIATQANSVIESDGPWYAILQTHHLICDNESLEILLSEVAAHLQGRPQELPAPQPYRNHVAQASAQARQHETQAFFRAKLADVSEPTAPFGLLDVRGDGSRIQTARQRLEPALASRIRLQARRLGVSAATLFHATWALVVAHTSGRDDVIFGTVLLGRMHGNAGAQPILGMFINTLPLRLPLHDLTAEALVKRTQQELAQLLTHEQASLAAAQRCSAIDPTAPLFTSLLNYRISDTHLDTAFTEATGATVLASHGGTNYPVVLSVDDRYGQFALEIETDPRLDPGQMTRYTQTALESLIEALEQNHPSMALELSILPQSERKLLLESFNSTHTPYPDHALVHELFEAQAHQTPDAVALICAGRHTTYAELDERATQLARYLQTKGIGPDQLVAIALERSLEMIVALLATLKAGGAYVPLDPTYPTDRIAYILEDAAPKVLITQQHLKHRMPATSATTIALDSDWEQVRAIPPSAANVGRNDCNPSHLAYVIYTSGSTGRPKGVMVPHRGVVNFLNSMTRRPGISPTDSLLAVTTVSFDIAGLEIYLPLISGARLVLASPQESANGNALTELIEEHDITILQGTPATWRLLLGAGWPGKPTLKALCGGEALPRALSREIASRVACLWNLYGPTETTIWSCCHPITPPASHISNTQVAPPAFPVADPLVAPAASRITDILAVPAASHVVDTSVATATSHVTDAAIEPIGAPIDNTRLYILDSHDRPTPLGVPGEIHIGGAGVARGYLNRPPLTAERFLKDPFSPDPKARMYKTGDLGRWRPDGTLEYLGRNDHQVKIRGFRIEPGEIESQLTRHPQVREATVLAREDHPGDWSRGSGDVPSGEKRLVAYVVPTKASGPNGNPCDFNPSAESLRAHLKSTLPDYMVPSAFVVLQSLPLTPNGKLDRRALPAPERGAYATRQYEAPQGQVEEILAAIWQALLRLERVSRHDNFFELGGHSLLIVQMLERLRRVGLSAELRRILVSPTLKDLATRLTSHSQNIQIPPNQIPATCKTITPSMLPLVRLEIEHIQTITRAVPGEAANIQDIYPLTPLQEGLLFHHLLDHRQDAYVRPLLLSVSSREHLDNLIVALQAIIDRHDVLRTAFLWDQLPRPVQVVYRSAALPVEEIQLNPHEDPLEQLQQRMRPEHQHLDLCSAPLMRVQIASDPHADTWYALIQTHHLVCDNQSLEMLLSELSAHMQGRQQELPPPQPYREHVAQTLTVSNAAEEEAFFKSKLADIEEPTAPFGLLNVHGETHHIARAHETLNPELAREIRLQARRRAISAATLFHAAWAIAVAQTSGRDDVVFGTVLLGRLHGRAGAQQTLGMFINTLPLRLRLKDLTATTLVEQTQCELIELLSHEQSSLALAQRCSGIAPSVPLFSALLNYRHSAVDTEAKAPPNKHCPLQLLASTGGTHYPLQLSVDDAGDRFSLEIETDSQIEPHRMLAYVSTALQSLIRALAEAPQSRVLSWSILPEQERHQVVEMFNTTPLSSQDPTPATEELIHQLFERQAAQTPDAVAVLYEPHSLTYAQLNARANQVARVLRQKGIRPDQTVGLCVERGLEMMVGLLGILKAGGAYVPLDPSYPADRLAHLLTDAAPKVVLTQKRLRPHLPTHAAEIISLDHDWETIASQEPGNLDPQTVGLTASHLAYVIYTSGSTGTPKGVMVEHRNVVNLWRAVEHLYREPNACQRIGANAPFSFDGSVKQFVQLLSGCTLCLLPQEVRLDPQSLLAFINRNQIEGIDCTPSQLSTWLLAGLLDAPSSLRTVLIGGEAIDPALWTTLSRSSRVTFYNVYGPTECTVDSTQTLINGAPPTPHIGRPLKNTRLYILDAHQRPVPIGVIGQINIAGAGVARGYLNRPELTAERFVQDPFSSTANARLYKTGDLGRWRPDGTLEYLGRNDTQVKIRGFRIEPEEIQAQLTRHPQVKEAVVIAREHAPGDWSRGSGDVPSGDWSRGSGDVPSGEKHLVAYVVPAAAGNVRAITQTRTASTTHTNEVLSTESLRSHLKSVLPDPMLPRAFILLERLPLTSSGKLDRRALPPPEYDSYITRASEVPHGEIEETLAQIWQSLLRIECVGRDDNFFELGGHSLHVVKLLAQARAHALEGLSIKLLFKHSTIRQLAQHVTRSETAVTEPADMELEEGLL